MRESEARLILLPQPPAASSSACDVWFWSLSVLIAERNTTWLPEALANRVLEFPGWA